MIRTSKIKSNFEFKKKNVLIDYFDILVLKSGHFFDKQFNIHNCILTLQSNM